MRDPGKEGKEQAMRNRGPTFPLWRLGIIWDHVLLLHCSMNIETSQTILNYIAVDRTFWKIKRRLWHWELWDGFNWATHVSYDWSMVAFGNH